MERIPPMMTQRDDESEEQSAHQPALVRQTSSRHRP